MSRYEVGNQIIGRQRPPTADRYVSADAMDESFPSGHTAAGLAMFLVLGLILWHIGHAKHRTWLVGAGIGFMVFGRTWCVTDRARLTCGWRVSRRSARRASHRLLLLLGPR